MTRDIEVKNNLTIAGGEWGEDSRDNDFQELLIIKETWRKPRGRV